MKILELLVGRIGFGGQEMFVYNMLHNMDCTGMEIDCLAVNDCTNTRFEEMVQQKGGKVYALNLPYRWDYFNNFMYAPVRNFLKTHTYDLIHIHSCGISSMAVVAAAVWRAGNRNVIVHSHATGKKTLIHSAFKLVMGLSMARHVKKYCACSRAAAEWKFIAPYGKHATVIKCGIDVEKYRYDPAMRSAIRNSLGIPASAFVVGNVGRFAQEKNHAFLLNVFEEVAKKNAEARLLLVGDGKEMNRIRLLVQSKQLEDQVIFTGSVSNVEDYLQAMDVFVFPSLYEGFGIVAIEAIASGLPVIASDRVPQDIDMGGRTTFISLEESPERWAEAVLSLDGQERRDHVETVREAGYDIRTIAGQVREMYLHFGK